MLSPRGYKPRPKFTFTVEKYVCERITIKGVLQTYADDFDQAYSSIKQLGFKVIEQVQTPESKPPTFR